MPPSDPDALAAALATLPAGRGTRFEDPHSWNRTLAAYDDLFVRIGAPALTAADTDPHGASRSGTVTTTDDRLAS